MDFRGRTYALPPHFNQHGGDASRAMIKFAKEKPLGPNGLDWLKIHLINLTGLKKRCSLAERLAFANENMEEILDSADNPLEVIITITCTYNMERIFSALKIENFIGNFFIFLLKTVIVGTR